MSLGPGRVTGAWGDPSTGLSMSMHTILNGFMEALVSVDRSMDRSLLIVAVPSLDVTPPFRVAHWIGAHGAVTPGPVPGWLPYADLAAHHKAETNPTWDYLTFRVETKPDRSGLAARIESGHAGDDHLMDLLTEPGFAHGILFGR